jgi:hypothetical protein
MKLETIMVPFLLMGIVVTSCGSSDSGGNDGSNESCNGTSLVASEVNNYTFSSTLTSPPISVSPNSELSFDWSSVTTDFIGHDLDTKKELNIVSVLMWTLPLTDLETKLNADTLQQSALTVVPLTIYTDGSSTFAKLFSFTLNGNTVQSSDILPYFNDTDYPPDSYTYLFTAASGTTVGRGIRMIQAFQLDPNSTNTTVTMTSDSTKLTYTANLHSLAATRVPKGQSAITLDWSQMKTNALGNKFIPSNITTAMVAHYTQTTTELEAKFLDIQLIATALYQGTIETGTSVDFSSLTDANGNAFPGIDDGSGTWVVALQCGSCRNPAPWYISILKPCS